MFFVQWFMVCGKRDRERGGCRQRKETRMCRAAFGMVSFNGSHSVRWAKACGKVKI